MSPVAVVVVKYGMPDPASALKIDVSCPEAGTRTAATLSFTICTPQLVAPDGVCFVSQVSTSITWPLMPPR